MYPLLLVYFFLLPFQWALSPTPEVDLALIRVFTLGIVLFWLGRALLSRRLILPEFLSLFFGSGFLLLVFLSGIWAENSGFALRKGVFLLSFLPFLFVLTSWLQEAKSTQKEGVIRSFVLGAFLSALLALSLFFLQFFWGVERVFTLLSIHILPFFLGNAFGEAVATYPSLLVNLSGATVLRASGVFPDPHMFSFYLGLALPFALALFLAASSRKGWWLAVVCIILLADLLSFSRGGYVGLLAGGMLFLVGASPTVAWKGRRVWLSLGLGLALLSVLVVSPLGTRFFSSFSGEDGSNRERLRLWQEGVAHVTEQPWLGTGLGNYPLLVKPSASYREPIYAHNLFLDVTLEVGIIGLSLFLGIILLAYRRAWVFWKRTQSWPALAACSALSVFLAHSFFETPLFSVHVLPALLLVLALGVSYRHD